MNEQNDGLKVLVDMARRGEIDPWDIDLIEVTDRYLEALEEAKSQDLRLFGKMLFYASVLLRIKAEIVGRVEESLVDDEFDWTLYTDEVGERARRVTPLEIAIVRRLKQPRHRPLTLADLLEELSRFDDREEKRVRRNGSVKLAAEPFSLEALHQENPEEELDTVRKELDDLFQTKKRLTFQDLLSTGLSPSTTYISLLFLVANQEIELDQRAIYSTLYITKVSEQ
ncbi:MAG: segregation/condensation protein A [Candidatus Tectomicrobia bacterium]|nr:segregation/condensation protein A [Candidatus Tectomicrobia bacterium]